MLTEKIVLYITYYYKRKEEERAYILRIVIVGLAHLEGLAYL